MIYNTARVKIEEKDELLYQGSNYTSNPVKEENSVIEGSFYQVKPMTIREMVTRKINKSLCCCLMITIAITFVSYYIAMNYEAKMNNLENQDLQAELDKYKSFNNVDSKIGEYNLLQKADKVIEVTALNNTNKKSVINTTKTASSGFNWAIGY